MSTDVERKMCCEVFAFRNGSFSLICKFCRDKFITFSAFAVHLSEKHSPVRSTKIKSEDDDTKENLVQQIESWAPTAECVLFEEKPHPKGLEESTTASTERIMRKQKVPKPQTKKKNGKSQGKSAPTIHKCSYCGKTFSSKRLRVDHENVCLFCVTNKLIV